MAVQAVEPGLRPLQRGLQSARRRLWLQIGVRTIARGFCAGLVFALVGTLLTGWQAPGSILNWFWFATLLSPVAGLLASLLLRPTQARAARSVDQRLQLRQQLGTAQELLSRNADGALVSMQLARAASLADEIPVSRAFPLMPRREVATALLLAVLTTAMLALLSAGFTLPNPLAAIRLPSVAQRTAPESEKSPFGKQQENANPRTQSPALEGVRQIMDQLQKQSTLGRLSGAAASAALAQATAELNRVAAQSQAQQQALEALSSELRNTAAGRDAGESLRQGDYQQAAKQLQQVGRDSDQLSDAAKRELSDALNRAAAKSEGSPALSKSESDAARQLQQGDYSSVTQSMDRLAQSLQNAGNQTVSQSELAQSWQQLQQLSKPLGQSAPTGSDTPPPVAQTSPGAAERTAEAQQAAPAAPGPAGPPAQAQGNSPGSQPGSGGAPGNQGGSPATGSPQPRLGADGKPLEVEGTVSGQFSNEQSNSPQPPSVTRQGTGNSISSGSGGADGPTTVPAENVFVPGERRPTVRDYFSKGSGQ